MIHTILQSFFLLLFIYLTINAIYFFILSIAGKLNRGKLYHSNANKKKIAVLIPSYKEDSIIVNTASKARTHDYPSTHFDVFVAAHHLKKETIEKLKSIPVNVIEVQFEVGSKARSLNKLLNFIPEDQYEMAIVLDADNIMLPGCLEKVNDAFQKGFKAVQIHRVAKNKNTPFALLDAISEEINNNLFRSAQRTLGFSSVTIGSGMAFEFKKIKEIYNKPGILGNPACDREVDFEIMRAGICIEFIPDAYVLDEKVSTNAVFERQRTRWLESQIIHLRLFFSKDSLNIRKTKDYWNKLFINFIPPRSIFLFVYFFILILFIIEKSTGFLILAPTPIIWFALFIVYSLSILISIPRKFFSFKTLHSILYIPALMIAMLKALFKMNVDRKEFLHTPKAYTQDPQ